MTWVAVVMVGAGACCFAAAAWILAGAIRKLGVPSRLTAYDPTLLADKPTDDEVQRAVREAMRLRPWEGW